MNACWKLLAVAVAAFIVITLISQDQLSQTESYAKLYANFHASYSNLLSLDKRVKSKTPPRRIGVIGGGIGGTSAAYFLRYIFGSNVQIDIYEASNRLCGRVASLNFNNRKYEYGAAIIHPKNYYFLNFVEDLQLHKATSSPGSFSVFDGSNYLFASSSNKFVTFFKMIWNFGLDIFRLNILESKFIEQFISTYKLQAHGHSYTSTQKLLFVIGGDMFINSTKATVEEIFHKNGLSDPILNTLVNGGLRNNYGQDCKTNGFVGLVSMAGIQPGLWSVHGGNEVVCEGLARKSNANIIHKTVSKVSQETPSHVHGQFGIQTKHSEDWQTYDIIVLAAPNGADFDVVDLSEVCDGCDQIKKDTPKRVFRQTTANFVKGRLNSTLFKCNSIAECPKGIFVSNLDLFYRSIGFHVPVDYDPKKDKLEDVGVYKVFSTNKLTDEQINYLFDEHTMVLSETWSQAYPLYKPPDPLPSFVLNKNGIYYINSIEWAASSIEMSTISAKNSANLAFNMWYGIDENIDNLNPTYTDLKRYDVKEDL